MERRIVKRNLLSMSLLFLLVMSVSLTSLAAPAMASAADSETAAVRESRQARPARTAKKACNFKAWSSLFLSDYGYNVYCEPLKIEYSGNNMIIKYAILNNTIRKIYKFSYFRVAVYCNGKQIVNKKIRNISFRLGSYNIKKLTLKVPFSKKKQKKYKFSKNVFSIKADSYYRYRL